MLLIYDIGTMKIVLTSTEISQVRSDLITRVIPARYAATGEKRMPYPASERPDNLPSDWPVYYWSDALLGLAAVRLPGHAAQLDVVSDPAPTVILTPDLLPTGVRLSDTAVVGTGRLTPINLLLIINR